MPSGRQRGARHYINKGEELHVGPLRILVNVINDPHEGDKASVSTFVFFTPREGEGIILGSGTVKLSMLEELKRVVEAEEVERDIDEEQSGEFPEHWQ